MTPKISLITAVGAVALVLGAPAAFGKSQPQTYPTDVVERAVLARELANRAPVTVYRDAFERAVAGQSSSTLGHVLGYRDAFERAVAAGRPSDRSVGLNRLYKIGEFASTAPAGDAFERAVAAGSRTSGIADRSIALNRLHDLGEFAATPMSDVHDRVGPVVEPPSTPVGSGSDVEWPQIGIGFAIGLLLALGLWMAIRLAGVRPLAH